MVELIEEASKISNVDEETWYGLLSYTRLQHVDLSLMLLSYHHKLCIIALVNVSVWL